MMSFWIIFAFSMLLTLLAYLLQQKVRERGTTITKEVAGMCMFVADQTLRKSTNKARILKLLNESNEVSNADIRDQLDVSRRSVTRYMTQLEREGRVEQIGDAGRGVIYKLVE